VGSRPTKKVRRANGKATRAVYSINLVLESYGGRSFRHRLASSSPAGFPGASPETETLRDGLVAESTRPVLRISAAPAPAPMREAEIG